jgi:putative RNA 2'-phosphotransferase
MNIKEAKRISKFLSLVLRHRPERIGITLDEGGWVSVDVLLEAMAKHGQALTQIELEDVVRENDKQRFSFDATHNMIRATQGHSVDVQLGYEAADPPDMLYHGTPDRFVPSIRREGLSRQQRHHVHLHTDKETALTVGRRRGIPVLLVIDSARMQADGHLFYVTPNHVWLTDAVPSEYIRFPESSRG